MAGRPDAVVDAGPDGADPAQRMRPVRTLDTAWWFDGCLEHRLLIQRCGGCAALRHPPRPMCGHCRSLSWDSVCAGGAGTVHSWVVIHHPKAPGHDYPHLVGLIDLAEGTRIVGDLIGVDPGEVRVGMAVALDWLDVDEELSIPRFRAVDP